MTKFHGRPCKHGHGTEKYISNHRCVVCTLAANRKWDIDNPDKRKVFRAAYMTQFRAEHPDIARARVRAAQPSYYRRNKAKYLAHWAAHEAAKAKRTPPWANMEKIQQVYAEAKELSEFTEMSWHVDHVIPLRGKLVSGLHVHTNLQLLLGADNNRKNNQFEVA